MVNLYRATKKEKYLLEAVELGNWLLDFMSKNDGSFYPKYDTHDKQYIDTNERWSTQTGSFLTKNIIGLINLSELSGDEKYAIQAKIMCDISLDLQENDGRFITNQKLNDTYMHPHCYTIEGLIAAWLYFDDERYIEACYRAADWIKNAQLENGGISRIFYSKNFSKDISTDSTAQSLRAWILLAHFGDYKFPEKQAKEIVKFLLDMQCNEEDRNAHGGFYYGITNEKLVRHISDHGTMFTLQTLQLYKELFSRNITFEIRYLI